MSEKYLIDLLKYIGKKYDSTVDAEIIMLSQIIPEIYVLPYGSVITCDYRPHRYRIYVNNMEEQIIISIRNG